MSTIEFTQDQLNQMKHFYQDELHKTLQRLEHLQSVLAKLEGNSPSIEITVNSKSAAATTPKSIASFTDDEDEEESGASPRRTRRKKRGPKPVWGNFILKRLRQVERPLTYGDLVDDAMAFMKLESGKEDTTRLAILNSAFRLRKVHGKIKTHRVKGKKEVYVGLSKWFDEAEALNSDYVNRIK